MGGFFRCAGSYDEIEVKDLIYKRYNSDVFSLPFEELFELVDYAKKKNFEADAHAQWCAQLPLMAIGYLKYISFADYLSKLRGDSIDMRPAAEIMAEIDAAHEKR